METSNRSLFLTQRGSFYVTADLLEDNPEEILTILKDFLILRAEFLYSRRAFEYVALSKHFPPVKEAYRHPVYQLNLTKNKDGVTTLFSVTEIKANTIPL
jgi:hypothetical protein